MSYSDMVAAAMTSDKAAKEWFDYLSKLNSFQTRQIELMHDLGKKRKGMSGYELAKAVLPILRTERLCEGLPGYVVNGY